jgi:hypothetical protein
MLKEVPDIMNEEISLITWNYRVLAFSFGETYFEVRAVYYKNGLPISFTDPGQPIQGSSVKSIRRKAKDMCKALEKPILWGNLVGEKNKFPNKYRKFKKKIK